MSVKSIFMTTIMIILCWMTPSAIALTLPPIPIEPIYFEPPIVNASDEIKHLNCVALDNNIRYLHPYR